MCIYYIYVFLLLSKKIQKKIHKISDKEYQKY